MKVSYMYEKSTERLRDSDLRLKALMDFSYFISSGYTFQIFAPV